MNLFLVESEQECLDPGKATERGHEPIPSRKRTRMLGPCLLVLSVDEGSQSLETYRGRGGWWSSALPEGLWPAPLRVLVECLPPQPHSGLR